MEKLERSLGGIQDMDGMPQAMFVIDVGNEKIAISEANRLRIPVIGVVDTNNNPDGIEYVIPATTTRNAPLSSTLRQLPTPYWKREALTLICTATAMSSLKSTTKVKSSRR